MVCQHMAKLQTARAERSRKESSLQEEEKRKESQRLQFLKAQRLQREELQVEYNQRNYDQDKKRQVRAISLLFWDSSFSYTGTNALSKIVILFGDTNMKCEFNIYKLMKGETEMSISLRTISKCCMPAFCSRSPCRELFRRCELWQIHNYPIPYFYQ